MSNDININKLLTNLKDDVPERTLPSNDEKTQDKLKFIVIGSPNTETDFFMFPNRKDPHAFPFHYEYLHWWVNPNTNVKSPYKCSFNKKCPMCFVANQFKRKFPNEKYNPYDAKKTPIAYGLNSDLQLSLIRFYNDETKESIRKFLIEQLEMKINLLDYTKPRFIKCLTRKEKNKRAFQSISTSNKFSMPREVLNKFFDLKPLESFYSSFSNEELLKVIKKEKFVKSKTAYTAKQAVMKQVNNGKDLDLNTKKVTNKDDPDYVDEITLNPPNVKTYLTPEEEALGLKIDKYKDDADNLEMNLTYTLDDLMSEDKKNE